MTIFEKNDRVKTPLGPGVVVYKRYGSNDNEVAAYSVALDHKVAATQVPPFPSYSGTIFAAHDVSSEV
jgi:hypothetical protein